jgi:hypothetical protein
MEASGQTNTVFYVLTQDGYDKLSMNLAELRRYISDQDAANDFLERAIEINANPTPAPATPAPTTPAPAAPRKRFLGIF